MDPLHLLLIFGVILVIAYLVIVFIVPTDIERKRKPRRVANLLENKDREKVLEKQIHHLENTIPALRKQLEGYGQKEREWQKELAVEKTKVQKLQEKLNQEREWQQKEIEKFDKKTAEVNGFKQELAKLQDSFNQEHSRNLYLENEARDLKEKIVIVNDQHRALDLANDQLKSKLEASEREITRFKKETEFLSRQKEDTTWIAKSEYLKLEKKLKEAEEQLQKARNTKF